MRAGVRIGVDVGSVRIGVAASDQTGTLASPVEVLRHDRGGGALQRLAAIATEREAIEIVVGMPRSLNNAEGPAAQAARSFASDLARTVAPTPVRLVDERLSTVQAQRGMHSAGRSVRSSRAEIDAAAAVVILQSALDSERASGVPTGELVIA